MRDDFSVFVGEWVRIPPVVPASSGAARTYINVLLADEPTGNLDSTNGAQVMELLSDLNEAGTTIVMVTHSPADAEYSARTIHLFDGKVVSEKFIEQEYAAHLGT